MSISSNEIVNGYLEQLWNQGRTDLADKFVAEDLIQHNPSLADGRAALTVFIDGARAQMPDMKFVIKRSAAEDDLVFVHSHFLPAPDQAGMAVIDVFRVVNDLIVEHWDLNEAVPEKTASGREIV